MASWSLENAGPSATIGDLIKARRWADVKERIFEDPEVAFWTDPSNARTPLHLICRMDFSEEDEAPPNGNFDDDSSANFAPHVEVAQMLIDASHECDPVILPNPMRLDANGEGGDELYKLHMSVLTVKDYLGDSPLHCLCGHMRSACPDLVRTILASASDAGNAAGATDEALDSSRDESVEQEESHSRAPTTYEMLTAKNTHGCTALHFISEGAASWDISRLIVDSCRMSESRKGGRDRANMIHPMLIQDDDGDTPLHFACSAGMDPRFLQLLLEDEPSAVNVTNRDGSLPVDDLIVWFVDEKDSGTDEDIPIMERATTEELTSLWHKIEVLLRAARDKSDDHASAGMSAWRPLHAAAGAPTFPSFVLRLACKLFPDELSSTDENGMTPLHVAASQKVQVNPAEPDVSMYQELARCDSDREEQSMVAFLASNYPNSAHSLTNEQRLPLHVAVENGKSVADIKHLLSIYPRSLDTMDMKTRLYPFMLAAVDDNTSLEVLHLLLQRNPELVRSGIIE